MCQNSKSRFSWNLISGRHCPSQKYTSIIHRNTTCILRLPVDTEFLLGFHRMAPTHRAILADLGGIGCIFWGIIVAANTCDYHAAIRLWKNDPSLTKRARLGSIVIPWNQFPRDRQMAPCLIFWFIRLCATHTDAKQPKNNQCRRRFAAFQMRHGGGFCGVVGHKNQE